MREVRARSAAAALGRRCGDLVRCAPGARADFVLHDCGRARGRAALEAIVHGESRLVRTYAAGVASLPVRAV